MKKIGLAVCNDSKNYGSQLQVLATIKKLESMGYDNEIIRYKKKLSLKFVCQTIPRLFNPYFISNKLKGRKKNKQINMDPEVSKNVAIRNKRFVKFAKEYFTNLSPVYNGWEELVKKSNKDYDYFMCGSDQLWLPSNLGSHFYTLEFVNLEKRKISYATSFGVSQIPWYQKRATKRYLERFDYLSNREISGSEIVESLIGKKSKVVCDPTLLLTKEEWDRILKPEKKEKEKYIFCYFLGDNVEHREKARELKEKTGCKIITIPFLDNYVEADKDFADVMLYDIDTKDFINYIRNAEYVLTDSFHGTIFSLLNEKKFITFNRFNSNSKNSRNTRIDSLFKLLDIKDRRYNGNIEMIFNDIDYKKVNKNLEKIKKESEEFLKNALK